MDYMECAVCRAKSGSPVLCEACLHNRRMAGQLTQALARVAELEKLVRVMQAEMEAHYDRTKSHDLAPSSYMRAMNESRAMMGKLGG